MFDKVASNKKRWRDYQMDSGSESQGLLSSNASLRSKGSYGGSAVMFPDSETSDYESLPIRTSQSQQSLTSERNPQYSASRRPYHYHNQHRFKGGIDDLSTIPMTYNRFQYYNKLRTYAAGEDSILAMPDHLIPETFWVPYIPGSSHAGKQSSVVTIFSVWNTILGSSLLSMPWGIQRAGLLGGTMLMVLMGALCLYTSYLILRVHSNYSGNGDFIDVGDMCRMLLGRYTAILTRVISLLVLLGASIVYWVLMSNFFYNSVSYFHDSIYDSFPKNVIHLNVTGAEVLCPRYQDTIIPNVTMEFIGVNITTESTFSNHTLESLAQDVPPSLYEKLWSVQGTVPIYLAVIIFPLVNIRSATFFTKFNSLGTLSVIYLVIFVAIKAASWGIHINLPSSNVHPIMVNETSSAGAVGGLQEIMDVTTPLFLPSFPALSGMLALSFFIHNIIINIMRSNQHQENNSRDLSIAFVLVTLTYLIIGTLFYISFPLNKGCIEDAFLNNFPIWDGMTVAARLFLFFQLMTVYPLLMYMVRVQLFSAFPFLNRPTLHHVTSFSKVSSATSSPPQARMLYIVIINVTLITICILFAIFMPHIGTIIRFTGAVSGFVYVFTIPCLLNIASQRLNSSNEGVFSTGMSWPSLVFHMVIPVIAFANLVAQFFISDS